MTFAVALKQPFSFTFGHTISGYLYSIFLWDGAWIGKEQNLLIQGRDGRLSLWIYMDIKIRMTRQTWTRKKLWYYKSHAYRKWHRHTVHRWNLLGGHYFFFSVTTASFSMEHGFQHGGRFVWVMGYLLCERVSWAVRWDTCI